MGLASTRFKVPSAGGGGGGGAPELPTGGTITEAGGYRIHTFTAADSFVVPADLSGVEVLVVGGGGGGSGRNVDAGGGGGAGALVAASGLTLTAGTYPAVIGAGGAGVYQALGGTGGTTTFHSYTAAGGGGGGGASTPNGGAGACGGGGGGGTSSSGGVGSPGYNGGAGGMGYGAGGGGGMGAAGAAKSGGDGGAGGVGLSSSISGTATHYAGGGGGGGSTVGAGGLGGGGAGNGTAGTAGSGGGGGGNRNANGGDGGSGVVIVRYQSELPAVQEISETSYYGQTNTPTAPAPYQVKAGDLIAVVGVYGKPNAMVPAAAGLTFTEVLSIANWTGSDTALGVWFAISPDDTPRAISFTTSGGAASAIAVAQYVLRGATGVDFAGWDTIPSGTSRVLNLTPTVDDGFAICGYCTGSNLSVSVWPENWAPVVNYGSASYSKSVVLAKRPSPPAEAQTATFTASGSNSGKGFAVVFR